MNIVKQAVNIVLFMRPHIFFQIETVLSSLDLSISFRISFPFGLFFKWLYVVV